LRISFFPYDSKGDVHVSPNVDVLFIEFLGHVLTAREESSQAREEESGLPHELLSKRSRR
jgi:hypothetical protein